MTFDLKRMLESKRALRQNLARLPLTKKLALLEVLRDRALTIRAAATRQRSQTPPQSHPRRDAHP